LVRPYGTYLNQPNPHAAKWTSVKWKAVLALLLYVFIQFAFLFAGSRQAVFDGSFQFERAATGRVLTSPRFTIKSGPRPVWIRAHAPVDNNWLGLDVDLVNTKTNETFSTGIGIEYYHGYDGESWSEGSQQSKASLPGVPAGEYILNIEPEGDPQIDRLPFTLRVESGGLFWSNFWLGLVLLLIYPGWVLFRSRSFEVSRWSESDFSPYASSEDSE
jgi:hypothetical protein